MKKQHRRRSKGKMAYTILVALVLVVAAAIVGAFYNRTTSKTATALPVRINMSGFTPGEIQAKAGEPIQIELINLDDAGHTDGGGWHNFVIESLNVSEKVAPTRRHVFTITPDKPGEYDFYCDICCGGKENPYMHGRLIVT